MPNLHDGESVEMQGSGRLPYVLKNVGGVYSCSCPAWRNQSLSIERRTCKHLVKLRGEQAESERVAATVQPSSASGVKISAPALLLAETWDGELDPTDWWLSEKLDGVRAWWDGKQFWSRQGNRYHAPDWFTARLPNTPLDGELWLARGAFQRTVSIVRRQDATPHWRDIRFRIFDAPGTKEPFEQRLEYLADTFSRLRHPHASVLPQQRCLGVRHLNDELERVVALGGEGLMLRQPGSDYIAGRSSTLLKVKRFHDAEAKVLAYLPGAGRHRGRLGALACALPDGTRFSVGTGFTDAEREHPPAIGCSITFRYQELTDRGVPRFPSFVRVRTDANDTSA